MILAPVKIQHIEIVYIITFMLGEILLLKILFSSNIVKIFKKKEGINSPFISFIWSSNKNLLYSNKLNN